MLFEGLTVLRFRNYPLPLSLSLLLFQALLSDISRFIFMNNNTYCRYPSRLPRAHCVLSQRQNYAPSQ